MAMVVGGINLAGGEGGVSGAVFGALLVGIINNMIILLGIPSDYTKAIQGVVIIAAVAVNIYSARKAAGIDQPPQGPQTGGCCCKTGGKRCGCSAVIENFSNPNRPCHGAGPVLDSQ